MACGSPMPPGTLFLPRSGVVFALCSALAAEVLRTFRLMELEAEERSLQ